MSLPWEASAVSVAGVPLTAEKMQPDSPIPAVATNTVTGQQIGVDIAGPLRAAIDQAIAAAVAAHPVLGATVQKVVRDSERADRTLMQSSIIDITVAAAAALVTIVSPTSDLSGLLWLAAAVLASRTLIQAGSHRAIPGAVP